MAEDFDFERARVEGHVCTSCQTRVWPAPAPISEGSQTPRLRAMLHDVAKTQTALNERDARMGREAFDDSAVDVPTSQEERDALAEEADAAISVVIRWANGSEPTLKQDLIVAAASNCARIQNIANQLERFADGNGHYDRDALRRDAAYIRTLSPPREGSEDTARLDWLDAEARANQQWNVTTRAGLISFQPAHYVTRIERASLREAIDAARSPSSTQEPSNA